MSSSTCANEQPLDLHHTTTAKVAVAWQEATTRYLTQPDPKSKVITFNTKFNEEAAFFELGVSVKLKGLDTLKNVMVRVCASSILSLKVIKNPTIPIAIGETFNSTALRLDFTLNCHPTLIVPTAAVEPLSSRTKPSGVVLDAIRALSKVTALSIYIDIRDEPPELQQISDAASQGLYKSDSTRYHIAGLYGPMGGKIIKPSADTDDTDAPPSYDETASCPPPPPPPPLTELPSKKRPRHDTATERDDIALLWAELDAMKEVRSRVEALETTNKKQKQQNKELAEGMEKLREKNDASEKKYDALEEKYNALEKKYDALEEKYNALEKKYDALEEKHNASEEKYDALENQFATLHSENKEFQETYDCTLTELGEEMDGLEGALNFLQEGRFDDESLEMIRKVAVQEVITRLGNG